MNYLRKFLIIMSIKKYVKERTWQIACLLLGLALFFIGLWQLDLLCAPYIWRDKKVIEVYPSGIC